jgi:transcriptional regulator with PAS, ATPase and Fis domain
LIIDNYSLKDNLNSAEGNSNFSTFYTNGSETNIFKQNLEISEETLKLLVIGEKGIGKTLFIDKLIHSDCGTKQQPYVPTLR